MAFMLLQIGEFAHLVGLSVRTVRYYGDLGLLPPSSIDPASGYRRYSVDGVERARQLIVLKATGLSLEEIRLALDDELSPEQFRTLLEAKVAELESESLHLDEQLRRARAQLQQLKRRMEHPMPEITIKKSDPKKLAYIREQIGGTDEISAVFDRFFQLVDPADAIGPAGNVYHYFADDGSSIDVEAAMPVPDGYNPPEGVSVRTIDSTEVACVTHHGAFNRLHEAHAAVMGWIDSNGYKVAGPSYEWNLVCTPPVTQDNETYVTDIEVEVQKA